MTDQALVRLRRYAQWLDAGITIPGLGWRIGVESLLGLFPGFGDAAGAGLSGWIFVEAARRGASSVTLSRIAANIAIDALVGAVPIAGDFFDFAWKANLKNVELLERHNASPAVAHRADRRFVTLLTVGVVVACAVPIAGGFLLLVKLLSLLSGP